MASLVFDGRNGQWRVWYHDGIRRRSEIVALSPKGPRPRRPPAEAVARLEELERIEAGRKKHRPPDPGLELAELVESDLRAFRASHREQSAERLGRVGRSLLRFAALRKIRLVAAIGPDEAREYLAWRSAAGVGRNTLDTEIGYLSGIWRRAIDARKAGSNPWHGTARAIPSRRVEPDRPSWTPEEFERLLNQARPWLRRVLVLGTRTGLRLGELIAAEWSWLRFEGDAPVSITVPKEVAKSGKARTVPIRHRAVIELIASLDRECPRLLTGQGGRPIGAKESVLKPLRAACIRAGLAPVGSHAMRRSFARWAVLGQGPWKGRAVKMYVVSRWLGHASLAQTSDYLALDEDSSEDWMGDGEGDGEGDG